MLQQLLLRHKRVLGPCILPLLTKISSSHPSSRSLTCTVIMLASADAHPTPSSPSSVPPPDLPPAYRMWDERYSQEGFAYGTEPNDFLKATYPQLRLAPNSRILMLAEGEGRNGVFLAKHGHDVTCVDLSAVGLQKAQDLASQHGVSIQTVVADLGIYDFGIERWDCIVGIHCHLPPTVRERVLAAIPPSLKPGGTVLFETYTPAQLEYKTGGPPNADWMYSADIFAATFEGGPLHIERNEELIRTVMEGEYHSGQAAVVQFLGRKESTSSS